MNQSQSMRLKINDWQIASKVIQKDQNGLSILKNAGPKSIGNCIVAVRLELEPTISKWIKFMLKSKNTNASFRDVNYPVTATKGCDQEGLNKLNKAINWCWENVVSIIAM